MTRRILTILLLATLSLHGFAQVKENQSKNEAIVYDVATDPEAVSANLLQILQKMPLVQVNAFEEVTLTGLSGIAIYVDGVPQLLPKIGIGSFIKSMPANQVERLEIYTNHHVADQALDEGGIINIITRKQKDEGMFVKASGHTATSTLSGGNIMLNAKYKKFFFDGGYAYTYQNYKKSDNDATYLSYKKVETGAFIPSHLDIRHNNNHNAHLQTGFNLTKKDIIGFSYNLFVNPWKLDRKAQINFIPAEDYYLYENNKLSTKQTTHNLSAYYQHSFNSGGYLSLAYEQGSSKYNSETDIITEAIVPIPTETRATNLLSPILIKTLSSIDLKEHAVRLDAFVSLNHANAIGAGARYSSKCYDHLSNDLERWSVYLQYSLQLSKFRLNTGLQWERPYNHFYYLDDSNTLYPFLNASYQITPNGWFSVDYTIQRTVPEPALAAGWTGHKYLNKLNLNYHYNGTKLQILADLIYHNSPKSIISAIEFVSYDNYEEPYGYYHDIYKANIHYKQVLFSLAGSYKISPSIRLQATAMVAQQTYTIVNEKELDGTYGQLSGGAIFTFPGLFNLTANGGYYFPRQIKGNKEMGNYFYRLNLSKELLKKHLIVALYATDFIGDKRFTQTFNNLTERNVMQTKEFGLSLTYQFFKK